MNLAAFSEELISFPSFSRSPHLFNAALSLIVFTHFCVFGIEYHKNKTFIRFPISDLPYKVRSVCSKRKSAHMTQQNHISFSTFLCAAISSRWIFDNQTKSEDSAIQNNQIK